MPVCPNCGKQINEGITFCPYCGERLKRGFTHEERQKYIRELKAYTRERRPIEGTFIAKPRYTTDRSKGYRIGFVIMLILALVGLVASVSFYNQLNTTSNTLATTNDQLSTTEDSLATKTAELTSTESRLESTQTQLAETQTQLADKEKELALYQDTYGSVVESDVQPPFQDAHIVNYENARNPTWAQLLDFLLTDTTDQNAYVPDIYMCGAFARDVHNNAERAGIRTAYVAVKFASDYHALNAFKTTDRGLVFIDCTGLEAWESGPSNRDKTVNVKLDRSYIPKSLFPESGWSVTWGNMGTVLDVEIYW
jgi:hypothetical protein